MPLESSITSQRSRPDKLPDGAIESVCPSPVSLILQHIDNELVATRTNLMGLGTVLEPLMTSTPVAANRESTSPPPGTSPLVITLANVLDIIALINADITTIRLRLEV